MSISRSEHQNFRKQQHRAAGTMDALYQLAGLDSASWPVGRVVETGAYQSAKRLFLAGAEAARTGRKITAAERKAVSFMLGYKVAGPAVVGAVADAVSAQTATTSLPRVPTQPPFNDPAPHYWRQITIGGVTGWGCIYGDSVKLFMKQGKEWVHKATHKGVPMRGCPDWVENFWGYWLLAGDPQKRSTIADLYENVCERLNDGQEEPDADVHPVIAALWRDIVAGLNAAEVGTPPVEGEGSFAFRVSFEITKTSVQ